MKLLALCLLAVTAAAKADGGLGLDSGLVYAPGHASADYYAYPAYAFEYSVKDPHTGDNKAQWEKRDGDVVKGAYSLVEPDGSVRVVEYYADDKTGFNAVVKRLGPNLHPTGPAVEPIYKAPIPVLGHGHGPLLPITVGPVAKLDHLAAAPLITGPISAGPIHGAISSAAIYKPTPILKPIVAAPIEHEYIPAPIIKEPLYNGPYDKHSPIDIGPIIKEGPIHAPLLKEGPYNGPWAKEGPLLSGPIYKSGPILSGSIYKSGPIYSEPIYKSGPIYSEPIYKSGPIYSEPIYKSGPIIGHGSLGIDHGYGHGDNLALLKSAPLLDLGHYGGYAKANIGALGLNQHGDLGHGYLEKGPLLSGWGNPYLGLKH